MCPETCEVTIRGKDLDLIQTIETKIMTENFILQCSKSRSENAFLDVLPGGKLFNMSLEDDIACLTFRCIDMQRYSIFRCTLKQHFEIERKYNQHNCTIVGFSKPVSFSSLFEKLPSRLDGSLSKLEISQSAKPGLAPGLLISDSFLPWNRFIRSDQIFLQTTDPIDTARC